MLVEVREGAFGVGGKQRFVGGVRRGVLGGGEVVEVDAEAGLQAVGERIDGVGDQPGVVAGRDRVGSSAGVGELFGGDVEQVAWCPLVRVRGADRGDQPGPCGIGGNGFGQNGSEYGVDVGDPGGA